MVEMPTLGTKQTFISMTPPLATVAASIATGGWDTVRDVSYDVRPLHVLKLSRAM
jgi:hypothetical protein